VADVRKLRQAALKAVEKADWKRALECYGALAQEEPADPVWALRIAEISRRLGRKGDAVEAFARASDLYARQGFLLKAIAACKTLLEIEPGNTAALETLAALHAASGRPAPGARPAAAAAPPVSAPLEELSLGEYVRGRSTDVLPVVSSAIEIPLDEDEPAERALTSQAIAEQALPKTPFFSALSERHLRMAVAGTRLVRLAPGEAVFRQGDPGDALFVVASGEVAVQGQEGGARGVRRASPDADHRGGVWGPSQGPQDSRELARLGEGAFFGEIALLVDQPRNATVVAATDTELLAIDRALVHALVADAPALLQVILRFLRDRLLASVFETSPLFAPFSAADRKELAARFRWLEVERGVALTQQGQPGRALFVLLAGRAAVVRDGARVAALGPFDVCGELSLLDQAPAVATVETESKCFVLALPRAGFAELVVTHPQILEYVGSLADGRRRGPAIT
jgi:CRP-like cAMP-binding protein